MQLLAVLTTLSAIASTSFAAPLEERADPANIGLYIDGTGWDINYLQTQRVSYANTSAYIGAVKYETYSEPLVTNALSGSASDGLSFLSIHSSPTGWQPMYVVPRQSQPVGFGVPHGGVPQGVRTTGFSFGPRGALLNNGFNKFYACQDSNLDSLHAWQIYWLAAGNPKGLTCKGPIKITSGDACQRY